MKLTKQARAEIAPGKFAGPHHSFPVENKNHAKAALLDVGKSERAGNISSHEAAVVRSAAHRELKK